jgi:pentatricopeptide repeat protein
LTAPGAPGRGLADRWERPSTRWVVPAALLSLLLSALAADRLGPYLRPSDFAGLSGPARAEVHVPSTLRAAASLTGFRVPAGHLFWLAILQHYGDPANAKHRYARILDYCLLASDLNPHFVPNYEFGASVLAFHVDRVDEAILLLNRGIEANPDRVRLKYLLAAILYQNSEDHGKAIFLLERQIAAGGAPPMLVNILANTYKKAGQVDKAIALWQRILKHTTRSDDRDQAVRALEELYLLSKRGKR